MEQKEKSGTALVAQQQHDTDIQLFGPDGDFENRISLMKRRIDAMKKFVGGCMTPGVDYGTIFDTKKKGEESEKAKKVLLKPGAEKLLQLYRYSAVFTLMDHIQNDKLIYYRYKCQIIDQSGMQVAEGEGSCNTMERKYRNQRVSNVIPFWKATDEEKRIGKKEKRTSKKGNEYDVYVIEGEIITPLDLDNTVSKMAQKRALMAATLLATRLSADFTQDVLDDPGLYGHNDISAAEAGEATVVDDNEAPPPAEPPREEKKSRGRPKSTGKGPDVPPPQQQTEPQQQKEPEKPQEPVKSKPPEGLPAGEQAKIAEKFAQKVKLCHTHQELDMLKSDMKEETSKLTGIYRDDVIKKGRRRRDAIDLVKDGQRTWEELDKAGV